MLKTALIIPDCHIPYHHFKAYNLMMSVARELDPHEIVVLGDFADFYSVNFYGKHPSVFETLKDEVEEVNKKLDEIDFYFPLAKKVFICGNHELRLERYLCEKAPALFGITSVEHLFKLDSRIQWSFIPWGPSQLYSILGSSLYAKHRPPGSHAKLTTSRALCNLVYGDIHRIEESHIVSLDGKSYVSFCPGWLGDKRKNKVFEYLLSFWQWSLGFAIVTVDTETGLFYHQKIPILEYGNNVSCVFRGNFYKA